MGNVYWPTILAKLFDLHAYFIISLSFYDLLKSLSSCRKMVHCGAYKGFNLLNKLLSQMYLRNWLEHATVHLRKSDIYQERVRLRDCIASLGDGSAIIQAAS